MLNLLKRKSEPIKVFVTVYLVKDEGVYYAYSPTMPGLHVEGETEEEVKKNVQEAVGVYLISLIKHKEPLPLGTIYKEPEPNVQTYSFTENIPSYAF